MEFSVELLLAADSNRRLRQLSHALTSHQRHEHVTNARKCLPSLRLSDSPLPRYSVSMIPAMRIRMTMGPGNHQNKASGLLTLWNKLYTNVLRLSDE